MSTTASTSASTTEDLWLPLLDYSVRTGVSMSTLRRHIKSKRIRFRIDHGKYWVPLSPGARASALAPTVGNEQKFMALPSQNAAPSGVAASDLNRLQAELKSAREEIAELKTLIAFYEESSEAPDHGRGTRPVASEDRGGRS